MTVTTAGKDDRPIPSHHPSKYTPLDESLVSYRAPMPPCQPCKGFTAVSNRYTATPTQAPRRLLQTSPNPALSFPSKHFGPSPRGTPSAPAALAHRENTASHFRAPAAGAPSVDVHGFILDSPTVVLHVNSVDHVQATTPSDTLASSIADATASLP